MSGNKSKLYGSVVCSGYKTWLVRASIRNWLWRTRIRAALVWPALESFNLREYIVSAPTALRIFKRDKSVTIDDHFHQCMIEYLIIDHLHSYCIGKEQFFIGWKILDQLIFKLFFNHSGDPHCTGVQRMKKWFITYDDDVNRTIKKNKEWHWLPLKPCVGKHIAFKLINFYSTRCECVHYIVFV